MATESDLRDLLRDPDPEGRPAIDLDAVLSRARRRRRPKVIAAQALGSVAAVGAIFVGISALVPPQQTAMTVAEDAAGGSEENAAAPQDAGDAVLRWAMDACGEAPVSADGSPWTLELEPTETGIEPTNLVEAEVTLRNEGEARVTGAATVWSITLVRDGVVVGYAEPRAVETTPIDLEPDGTLTWIVSSSAGSCVTGATLAPGAYEGRAVAEVVVNADGRSEVVYGTLGPVELR